MKLSFSILALIMAPLLHAIPLPLEESTPSNSQDSSISIPAPADPSPSIAKIDSPSPPPGTAMIEPPPLFDPPEPRPNPLFDHPASSEEEQVLRSPPIPESRTETLLPYDGAHVHPENTPYPPDAETIPGSCAYSWHCSWAKTTAEISGTLMLLGLLAYITVRLCDRALRLIVTRTSIRSRSPSGSLRAEPEIGSKSASGDEKEGHGTNKLLTAWRTGGAEKKVTFAV